MRYIQRMDGENFVIKAGEPTRLSCCDCGLVHDIVFVNGRGVVGVAAKINKRATAAMRRNGRMHLKRSSGPKPVKGYNPDGR